MKQQQPIYAPQTLEFVTVATEFCAYLEKESIHERDEFVQRMLKLLPLLYLKVQLLPTQEYEPDYFMPDEQVTEEDYEFVRSSVAATLGEEDDYEDSTFGMDIQQTELTCWKTISEGIADIYQPVRNFVTAYRIGAEACMETALWSVQEEFHQAWGTSCVDTLRRLHYMNNTQE